MKYIFKYYDEEYQIVEDYDNGGVEKRKNEEQLILNDFNFALKNGDYITITNRISQGLEWGWLEQIK